MVPAPFVLARSFASGVPTTYVYKNQYFANIPLEEL
jgi:hypothetical protein